MKLFLVQLLWIDSSLPSPRGCSLLGPWFVSSKRLQTMYFSSTSSSCRLHLLSAFLLVLCSAHPALGQTLVVPSEVKHDVSLPLRELVKTAQPVQQEREEGEEVKLIPLPPGFKPADVPDPVL